MQGPWWLDLLMPRAFLFHVPLPMTVSVNLGEKHPNMFIEGTRDLVLCDFCSVEEKEER